MEDDDEEWDDNTSMAASTISGISRVSGVSGVSGMSSSSRASLFSNSSAAPPEVSREDFDAILDDFLENYEVVGRRLRPALGGTGLTGPEKLQVLRSAVEGDGDDRDANRQLVLEIERLGRGQKAPKDKKERVKVEQEEKWDVETILSQSLCTIHTPVLTVQRHIQTQKTILPSLGPGPPRKRGDAPRRRPRRKLQQKRRHRSMAKTRTRMTRAQRLRGTSRESPWPDQRARRPKIAKLGKPPSKLSVR
jgi:protein LTV1